MQTAVFDLDGTLADTSADLLAAANACFEDEGHGAPLTQADHAAVAFAGGRAMLSKGAEVLGLDWAAADIDRNYPKLLAHYETHIDVHTVLYDGVEAALDELAAAGWALAVCTNKPEKLAQILLERLGIRDRFASLIGADTLPLRKPHPEPLWAAIEQAGGTRDRAALIGDTVTDAKTGQAADVPVVLVTFGPDGERVKDFAPEATLGHYRDLSAVLGTLLTP